MEEESIKLMFGVIFLILLINTTMIWSIIPLLAGRNSLETGGQDITNLSSQKIVAASISNRSGLNSSGLVIPSPGPRLLPALNTGVALADPPIIVNPAGSRLPAVQPALNTGVALSDSPLIVKTAGSRLPADSMAPYISIDMPERREIERHPALQPAIPRRNFDEFVTVFALENQKMPAELPRISMNQVKPPLVIDFSMSPISIRDVKYYEYKMERTLHKESVTVNRSSENSWFLVVVRDKDTGEIVMEDGMGRTYGYEKQRQQVLWTCGNYSVEFDGNAGTVNLTIKVNDERIGP